MRSAAGDELSASELYGLLRLRVDVFVVEQECPYPELDGLDLLSSTRHFWIDSGDAIAGCLRIIPDKGALRIGRVCTAGFARGSGVGQRLMAAAMEHVGDAEAVLGAQTYATGFYRKFGFTEDGDEYDEDGIPHVTMRRQARSM